MVLPPRKAGPTREPPLTSTIVTLDGRLTNTSLGSSVALLIVLLAGAESPKYSNVESKVTDDKSVVVSVARSPSALWA